MPRLVEMWQVEEACVNCAVALSHLQKMYSNGACPYCGHVERYAVTIVATNKRVFRWKYTGKWWQFWKREKEYRSNAS